MNNTMAGTFRFMAPEIKKSFINKKPVIYNKAIDIFSYGTLCEDVFNDMVEGAGEVSHAGLREFLDKCKQEDPYSRFTSMDLVLQAIIKLEQDVTGEKVAEAIQQ